MLMRCCGRRASGAVALPAALLCAGCSSDSGVDTSADLRPPRADRVTDRTNILLSGFVRNADRLGVTAGAVPGPEWC